MSLPKTEITKRTRGENENVYINRRIVLEDGGDKYDSVQQRRANAVCCNRLLYDIH